MTTTPTAAELQSLWMMPAPMPTPPPAIMAPAPITPPEPPPRCWHRDRSAWIDTPVTTRPGWIRTTCSDCGGFVGYRPANGKTK